MDLKFVVQLPWQLDEPAAMSLPSVMRQVGWPGYGFTTNSRRRVAFERSVKTVLVVVIFEKFELPIQVDGIPE